MKAIKINGDVYLWVESCKTYYSADGKFELTN